MDERSVLWSIGCDLVKADEGHVHGQRVRVIEGIASEETPDQQGETLVHSGINYDPFLTTGYINWDHQDVVGLRSPAAYIGIPTEARIIKGPNGIPAFWIAGTIFNDPANKPLAEDCWKHMQALAKSDGFGKGPQRRMGLSVQGRTILKLRKRIERSDVTDMAVTAKPVHLATNVTHSEILKSLSIAAQLPESAFIGHPEFTVRELLKAADYATDAPLLREDLDGKRRKRRGKEAMRTIYGDPADCKCGNLDRATGTFKGGRKGAVEHLHKCCGWDQDEAEGFSTIMKSAFSD